MHKPLTDEIRVFCCSICCTIISRRFVQLNWNIYERVTECKSGKGVAKQRTTRASEREAGINGGSKKSLDVSKYVELRAADLRNFNPTNAGVCPSERWTRTNYE